MDGSCGRLSWTNWRRPSRAPDTPACQANASVSADQIDTPEPRPRRRLPRRSRDARSSAKQSRTLRERRARRSRPDPRRSAARSRRLNGGTSGLHGICETWIPTVLTLMTSRNGSSRSSGHSKTASASNATAPAACTGYERGSSPSSSHSQPASGSTTTSTAPPAPSQPSPPNDARNQSSCPEARGQARQQAFSPRIASSAGPRARKVPFARVRGGGRLRAVGRRLPLRGAAELRRHLTRPSPAVPL